MDYEKSLTVDAYASTVVPKIGFLVRAGTDPKSVIPKDVLARLGPLKSKGTRELGYKKAEDQEALAGVREKGYHATRTVGEIREGEGAAPRR